MKSLSSFFTILILLALFSIPLPLQAAQRTVTSIADSGPGSLRAVIASAGADDEIVFAVPLLSTISLLSEIPINVNLTITGPGAESLTLDGGGATRIFNIGGVTNVTISGLRFFRGFSDMGGAIIGGVQNLAINNCIFESNEVSCAAQDCQSLGGAIFNGGGGAVYQINNTAFLSNRAYCTLAGCRALGGAVFNGGGGFTATFTGCTFESNEAECIDSNCNALGGAYFNGGGGCVTSFLNSTFYNNTAACEEDGCVAFGGSIFDGSSSNLTSLDFCTLSSDTSECSGAGCTRQGNSVWASSSPLVVNSNIFFNTSPEGSCDGSSNITSLGYNFDTGNNCLGAGGPGDHPFTDPRLFPGVPRNNGGPTPTIALLPESPAIDAGNPACPPPDTDQRGFVRPQFVNCDSGAFEFEGLARASNIPTLSEWGMIAMFLILGLAGFLALTRLASNA
ncbi:MAG TPA: IPTL-CTERM sorting domain-containing protein [Thermodesulfobacteriota bacterium]|nr:IPTL-CTERM sorting domain-containing protein [Thermodesulfobacteriota bacterium]